MHRVIKALAAFLLIGALSAGCMESASDPAADQVNNSQKSRASAFARADAKYPQPIPENFPLRKLLAEYTASQDEINHPWYIYLQSNMTNEITSYWVATTQPLNTCSYLSNPTGIIHDGWTDGGTAFQSQNPSLNGYYGGASQCDNWVFQDAATKALVVIKGNAFTVLSQPLDLNVPRLKVAS